MEHFTSVYNKYDTLKKYDTNFRDFEMIHAFGKWLIGEESDTYNEVKDDIKALNDQILEDIRAQDDNQIAEVDAWLTGYLTALNINF